MTAQNPEGIYVIAVFTSKTGSNEPHNDIENLKKLEIFTERNCFLTLCAKVNCHVLNRTPEKNTLSHPNLKSDTKPLHLFQSLSTVNIFCIFP